jgi:hypothetical protein
MTWQEMLGTKHVGKKKSGNSQESEAVVQQDLGNLKEKEDVGISAESVPIVEEDMNDTKEAKKTSVSKEEDDGGSNCNNSTETEGISIDGGKEVENSQSSNGEHRLAEQEVLQETNEERIGTKAEQDLTPTSISKEDRNSATPARALTWKERLGVKK